MTTNNNQMTATKLVSTDNGLTYTTPEAIEERYLGADWNVLANAMDEAARERAHSQAAPCTAAEFLACYLAFAPYDLVIG